jgi:hypothetical protein
VHRALIAYLIGYYLLIIGAVATLWRSRLIDHLDAAWTFAAIGAAITLGVLLVVLSRR